MSHSIIAGCSFVGSGCATSMYTQESQRDGFLATLSAAYSSLPSTKQLASLFRWATSKLSPHFSFSSGFTVDSARAIAAFACLNDHPGLSSGGIPVKDHSFSASFVIAFNAFSNSPFTSGLDSFSFAVSDTLLSWSTSIVKCATFSASSSSLIRSACFCSTNADASSFEILQLRRYSILLLNVIISILSFSRAYRIPHLAPVL